jgi:DNA-binding NarL/FixJ family response regulator
MFSPQLLCARKKTSGRAYAGDGEEGVLKAGQLQPAVVLMNINIPKMDGIAAAKDSKDVKTIWFRERKRGSYEHSRKSCVRV